MQKLMKTPGVIVIELDQCAYGLTATDESGKALATKSTRIVTTLAAAQEFLSNRCQGCKRHASLLHDRAKGAG